MNSHGVLITGATGNVGTSALDALLDEGRHPVRAMVRDPATLAWAANRGAQVMRGDFEDSTSILHAMDCIQTLVLITPPGPHAAEQAGRVVDIARQANVQRIVRLSAIKASEDGFTDNTRQHAITERDIRDSGIRHVFLRPNYFMQNLLGGLGPILTEGVLYAGMGQGRIGLIDARDVGEALAAAVSDESFDGTALELSGPASIGHGEVAAEFAKALGREIVYVPVPPEAAGEAVRALGLDDWTVRLITAYSRAFAGGFGDFTTVAVRALTGRQPRDIATFAREVLAPMARGA